VSSDRWTTGRLVLRRPAPQDADALFAIYSHPEVMRYWSRRPLVTRDEAVAMIENMVTGLADGTWHSWAVTRQGDDTPIGVCSLFNFVTGCRRAELGYILARASWGQGVMTEALGSVIAHAFGPLDLRRLEADADPRNAGSLRLLTRLGFVREGTLRARWEIEGEISDTAFYGLLKGDWLARRATDGDPTTGR
jgi:ribosomal-protein-alanine N-acetyltransferase